MRRWSAMMGIIAVVGCSTPSQRPSLSNPRRPTEFEVRKDHPKVQKDFRTSLHRVYSAGKAVLRDQGWQIATDRFLGTEAKIEARQGEKRVATVFIRQVTPIRTRVVVLVDGTSVPGTAADVHEGIATLLHLAAEDCR